MLPCSNFTRKTDVWTGESSETLISTQKHPEMTRDNLGNLSWSSLLRDTSKYLWEPGELANKFHRQLAVNFSKGAGNEGLEEKWQEWMWERFFLTQKEDWSWLINHKLITNNLLRRKTNYASRLFHLLSFFCLFVILHKSIYWIKDYGKIAFVI